jgi:lysozyme
MEGPMAMTPSEACAALIARAEGFARVRADGLVEAYPDPGSGGAPWTIGCGLTGPDIVEGTVWTREQCDARFRERLARFGEQVGWILGDAATTQRQFDAMVSFAFNVGVGNFAASTLLKKHEAGDHEGAAAQFGRWNKAGGRVLAGLTARRAAEAALYRGGGQ